MADEKKPTAADAREAAVETILKGPANADEVAGAPDESGKPRDPAKEEPVMGAPRALPEDSTGKRTRAWEDRPAHWREGVEGVRRVHGAQVTERAQDLVRRATGELYQEEQGGVPASAHAHEVVAHLGDADWLNEAGHRFQLHEGAHPEARLNQRGYALEG